MLPGCREGAAGSESHPTTPWDRHRNGWGRGCPGTGGPWHLVGAPGRQQGAGTREGDGIKAQHGPVLLTVQDRQTDTANSWQARGEAGTAKGRPCSKATIGNGLVIDRLNRNFSV